MKLLDYAALAVLATTLAGALVVVSLFAAVGTLVHADP